MQHFAASYTGHILSPDFNGCSNVDHSKQWKQKFKVTWKFLFWCYYQLTPFLLYLFFCANIWTDIGFLIAWLLGTLFFCIIQVVISWKHVRCTDNMGVLDCQSLFILQFNQSSLIFCGFALVWIGLWTVENTSRTGYSLLLWKKENASWRDPSITFTPSRKPSYSKWASGVLFLRTLCLLTRKCRTIVLNPLVYHWYILNIMLLCSLAIHHIKTSTETSPGITMGQQGISPSVFIEQ